MVQYSSKCVIKLLCSTEMPSLMNFKKTRLILILQGKRFNSDTLPLQFISGNIHTMVNRCCAYSMDMRTLSFPFPFF